VTGYRDALRPRGRRAQVEVTVALSKRQISLIAVLGTSVIGFLVDQILLSPGSLAPAKASASAPRPQTPAAPVARLAPAAAPVAASSAAAAPASAKSAGAPQTSISGAMHAPLAERLKALVLADGDPAGIREAFAPSAVWLASMEKAKPDVRQPDSTVDFARQHKLTSVLRRGRVGSAVVDGKVVEVGEQVDGYRLIGLASDSAVFRSSRDAKEVRLSIIGPTK
jgi:hypothetical protein